MWMDSCMGAWGSDAVYLVDKKVIGTFELLMPAQKKKALWSFGDEAGWNRRKVNGLIPYNGSTETGQQS